MSELQTIVNDFVLLWAVIDPIGTIPVFISATRNHTDIDRRRIALRASAVAAGILLFFITVGESVLNAMGVPILDSALAFFRRLGRGGRIFRADREHLHHRLLELGLTQRQVVVLLYYACAYLGLAAYVLSLLPRRAVLLVLILLAMGGVLLLETLKFVGRRRSQDS